MASGPAPANTGKRAPNSVRACVRVRDVSAVAP